MSKAIHQLVGEYANAVGRHGLDSEETRRVRAAHAGNKEFLRYADVLDRIKRHLGGKGMGRPEGRPGITPGTTPIIPEPKGGTMR